MSGEIEEKLGNLRLKLQELEAAARQIPHVKKEIAELEEELASAEFHQAGAKRSPKTLAPAPMPPMQAEPEALDGEEAKKRMKAINKKLQQIAKLKEKDELDAEAEAKVRGEAKLLKELECLKNGEAYVSDGEEPEPKDARLPTNPDEVQKRIHALKKKLTQIDALKAKGGKLDAEAQAKVDSERRLREEVAALEAGESKVVFTEPSLDEKLDKQTEEKSELERRLKALKKKIGQIDALKKKPADSLDADARAKLATEKDTKKELGSVERAIGEINKQERARVEERLG